MLNWVDKHKAMTALGILAAVVAIAALGTLNDDTTVSTSGPARPAAVDEAAQGVWPFVEIGDRRNNVSLRTLDPSNVEPNLRLCSPK